MNQPPFSLAEARSLVRDLFQPNPLIYWVDFLASIGGGMVCFASVRRLPEFLSLASVSLSPGPLLVARGVCFVASCLLLFRAVNFIHELAHLPERQFRGFRLAWNLLCGVPFLTPSFTYETHLDHHRRRLYGTSADGEYLPLGRLAPVWIALYLSQCLWAPLVAVIRFGLLTPLTWLSPSLRDWAHQRLSSLVMNPRYLRPLPTPQDLRAIRMQELLCFAWCVGLVAVAPQLLPPGWLAPFLLQAYATSAVLVLLNCLRTMAAHRFVSTGQERSFVEQLTDSIDISGTAPWEWLLNPVGLRYHATHHLFPSLPYHNLRTAHLRLHAQLPADSPYRQTAEPSLVTALANLWRSAWASREARPPAREERQHGQAA